VCQLAGHVKIASGSRNVGQWTKWPKV
jgi:hypothetical protein